MGRRQWASAPPVVAVLEKVNLLPMQPNSTSLTDAFSSLCCACGAAKRER